MAKTFQSLFPWLKYPIVSAAMAGVALADLAIAVSKAGAMGFIGSGYDIAALPPQFDKVVQARKTQQDLYVGVGLITFAVKDPVKYLEVLEGYIDFVCCIWLFGGGEQEWINLIKEKFPKLPIIVQVYDVKAAKEMVTAGADIIIAQGSDAGGHGGSSAASIVSLLPEIIAAVPGTPVLAAGGLSTGRTLLAARVLGAQGLVLGTRFMLSKEANLHDSAKELAVKTTDGGRTTVQTRVYDEMRGTTDWPQTYTGRAISNKTLEEQLSGRDVEELKKDYAVAAKSSDYSRVVCWAGTGVGSINDILPAGEIVARLMKEYQEARDEMINDGDFMKY